MFTKTVNYTDFNDNEVTETLYFNLSKRELVKMAMDLPKEIREKISKDPDNVNEQEAAIALATSLGEKGVFEFIEELVKNAYGVKSEDGRKFLKDPKLSEEFTHSIAYDELIMEFMSDENAGLEFVNKLIPSAVNDAITLPPHQE